MEGDHNKQKADQDNKPDQQRDTEKTSMKTPIHKNPNPRANENLTDQEKQDATTDGIGSEITDGEDG